MLVRAGLLVLAAPQAILGLWAVVAPRSFYDGFPGGGREWIAALGPFNAHLATDVGSLSLALVAVLLAAAWTLERRMVATAAIAWLLWSVPHLVFHLGADHALASTGDRVASQGGQAVTVLVAIVLLVVNHRRTPRAASQPPPTPARPSSGPPAARRADGSAV